MKSPDQQSPIDASAPRVYLMIAPEHVIEARSLLFSFEAKLREKSASSNAMGLVCMVALLQELVDKNGQADPQVVEQRLEDKYTYIDPNVFDEAVAEISDLIQQYRPTLN